MDKKKRPIIAIAVLTILISGYLIWERYFTENSLLVEASGTVEATTVELTARIAGTIRNIKIKAGEEVKQGDLVAQISRSDLAAQKERDALNVVIAQNKLDDLLSGARSLEIKEAEANVNIRQATYDKAKKDLERAEALYKEDSIALADFEVFENNSIVALNQLEAAQAKLNLLQAGSRDEQVKAAENQVKMMKTVLKSTEAVLADLDIVSPLKGTIQSKNYENGEFIQAGASVATVVYLEKVWINVYVPTDDLPYVKLGEKAEFTISGLDQLFEGKVAEIATQGEFTPKTIQTKKERANIVFKVKIEVDNSQGILKPGMPADVTIKKILQTDTSQEAEQEASKPESDASNPKQEADTK